MNLYTYTYIMLFDKNIPWENSMFFKHAFYIFSAPGKNLYYKNQEINFGIKKYLYFLRQKLNRDKHKNRYKMWSLRRLDIKNTIIIFAALIQIFVLVIPKI